jgi:hypothetical protein
MDNNYNLSKRNSFYEKELSRLISQGKPVKFTDEDSFNLVQELNTGLDDFLLEQKNSQTGAELELSKIILD